MKSKRGGGDDGGAGGGAGGGVGGGAEKDSITVEFLDAFNGQKKAIEKCIDAISLATKQTISLSDQTKSAINPDDIDKISKQLADVVKNAQRDATKGKTLLDALRRDRDVLKNSNPNSDRIQPYNAQYMRLCKLYVDAVKEHQKAKEMLRKVQTDDLVRRGMILYGDTKSESEIRAKVEQDPANFVREAIMEEAADEAQAAYAEAQSRARDVEFLVKSLSEVAAMFQDLAVLVQQQSEMLDSIESNVETAGKYVRKGNEALKDSIEYQKKTRKCYCCFICVLVVIIIAAAGSVGAIFGKKG